MNSRFPGQKAHKILAVLTGTALFALSGCADLPGVNGTNAAESLATNQQTTDVQLADSVVLFMGDGMGVSTVTAARIYAGQKLGKSGEEHNLVFETFPDVALVKTCLLYTSPSPRDRTRSRMPSSA